jgi:hypothetical protein
LNDIQNTHNPFKAIGGDNIKFVKKSWEYFDLIVNIFCIV